jgi:thiol-disulfide isomerase/thioredoxin
LEKKTVELFKQRGEYVERMAFAKIEAQRGLLRILIVLGDPQSEATRKFVELREKDITLGPGFGHFITMPIGADDSAMLRGLADEFGPDVNKLANPALVVLDEQGKLVATKASVIKAEAIAAEADELLKFLTDHAPSYPDADKLLTEALERARREGKRVFLQETATWCGPCRLLSEFINKHKTIFDDNYVYLKIDGRFEHAEQVMRRFRGDFSGVPWIAVLDAQATLLGTSVGPEGNYGFPSDPKSIDQFVQLMEKTAPRLGTDQLTELRQDLEAKSKTEVVK